MGNFFLVLAESVKWFGEKYGWKIAELIVWNMLIPSCGNVLRENDRIGQVRRHDGSFRKRFKYTYSNRYS